MTLKWYYYYNQISKLKIADMLVMLLIYTFKKVLKSFQSFKSVAVLKKHQKLVLTKTRNHEIF
jgi:flagellar biogenesis protein FliO